MKNDFQPLCGDAYCEDFYQKTTRRLPDGRYMVRLPFKEEYPSEIYLGRSRNMALAQNYRMEKNLDKNTKLKVQYIQVLQEYVELDHMEKVTHHEDASEKQSSFYLPHHSVIKPESKTRKVRVVFNASKKSSSGHSLNDFLHRGPILQSDLTKVLLKWHFYKYVFTGDIQKLYRQIVIHPDDRPYHRILFRKNPEDTVKTYELKRVTFGVNCAPFLAIRTLRQLGLDSKKTYPDAARILNDEVYVDDVLSGGHTIEEAKNNHAEVLETLSTAGFPMKKITANHIDLLVNLAREDLLDEDFLKIDDSSSTKTLGIHWNALSDTFRYNVTQMEADKAVQMRSILSVIARLYDPLGWLGPIVINAKVIMQKLWELKMDWNDFVPEYILIIWNNFLKYFPHITRIQIPRWSNYSPGSHMVLHGFCDASETAYCGVVYVRSVSLTDEINTCQLMAKTKVAPLKLLTIPKLELTGAVLLSKLIEVAKEIAPCKYEIFLWTDSSIVLGWLQKDPNHLKTFVRNRIAELQNRCSDFQWRHVITSENPADIGSRGCNPQDLINNNLWWHGPSWLGKPKEAWPEPRTFDPIDIETRKVVAFHVVIPDEELISRFSSLGKALRVVSQIIRFKQRCQKKSRHEEEIITAKEIEFVKNRLIIMAQKMFYRKEYENLVNKKSLSKKSPLVSLAPFLDKNGVMRVGGRLHNSSFRYDEKHPIIVPKNSHYAVLLVRYTHKILFHAEHHVMLRAIRQGYFIPNLRSKIKACIRECKNCTMFKRKFQGQLMGALPPERVTFTLPFTYTGVDFAGPLNLRTSNLRNAKITKGYVAVFVCFSTRAVHLEVCSDLTADAFLEPFARFIGRRGQPKTVFSDNGRNFLGANYKLLKEHNKFLKSIETGLVDSYSMQGLTWTFIPPYAPHMGGLWEAAVRSMKIHLKKVAAKVNFTFEELSTLLIQIEAVLNSRPLSPITEDANDVLPLTPGHFLRGAPLTAPPEAPAEYDFDNIANLNRWQRLKVMYRHFSMRWKSEYIVGLQKRYKWNSIKNNLKEGDVVIVKEDFLPSMEWCLGRVTKVFHGKDNNVRVAEIKTQKGVIIRPIVKLCILPTSNSTSSTEPIPVQVTVDNISQTNSNK